jgi:catechol 2,3-dioxygenase-like lactoylglutathione lyase family enzyme
MRCAPSRYDNGAVQNPAERQQERRPAMIKPKLHHVTLKTSRLDEMIAWYGAVIGAKVQFRDRTAAWTTNDEANHRIAFLAVPGLSDDKQKPSHNGMHHCAFEYGSFEDLMMSFERLRKEGIEPAFCLDHGIRFRCITGTRRATSSSCKAIFSAIGRSRANSCARRLTSPLIRSARSSIPRASMMK